MLAFNSNLKLNADSSADLRLSEACVVEMEHPFSWCCQSPIIMRSLFKQKLLEQ